MKQCQIYLERLMSVDVTENYVNWLNDAEINRYLESRFVKHDVDSVKLFVESMCENESNFLFGIFCNKTSKHIGNIKLGPIDYRYKRAGIGLLIGDKNYWGKNIATEALGFVCNYALETLKLNKVEAGCYASNIGSKKLFLKSGFKIEGVLQQHFYIDKTPEDCIRFGKILKGGS